MKHSKMTARQYTKLRESIGVPNYILADILGIGMRSAQRYEAAEMPIPEYVAKLLRLCAKLGLDKFNELSSG